MKPILPAVNIKAYLLAGLQNANALEAAAQLNDPMLNKVLAHHPSLTAELRAKLLASNELEVLILLARRLDLPPVDKIALLQRKLVQKDRLSLRIATMVLDLKAPPGSMSDALYEYASTQSWFTLFYQYSVATALAEDSPHRAAALERKKAILISGYPSEGRGHKASFIVVATTVKILAVVIKHHYKNSEPPLRLMNLELPTLLAVIDDEKLSPSALATSFQERTGAESVEFYGILFSLLETWTGPLNSLVTTAKSLTGM